MTKETTHRGHLGQKVLIPCISTTLVLLLLGVVVFSVTAGERLGRMMREDFSIALLLDDATTQHEAYEVQQMLRTSGYVRKLSYTSKEQAAKEQAEALGADPVEFLENNPMPASFDVRLIADYANTDSLQKILARWQAHPRVVEVVYPETLIKDINHNIRNISIILLAIAGLLLLVSVSLINNMLRLSIYARRMQIHTMKLVGARHSFIRKPFLRQAFWIGFVSALTASTVMLSGMHVLRSWDVSMQRVVTPDVAIVTVLSIFVVSLLMTQLSAYFAVNKHLRKRGSAVYLD